MITFIEGSAVYDVSGKMREKLCDTLSESDKNVFLIVPEQFEFETEKSIYSMLDGRGLLTKLSKVNVTTFSSLSRDILAKSGEDLPIADDIIKTIVMNKAVREEKNNLTALNGAADKSGFCEKMINTISALKTAGLTADDISGENGLFPSDGELGMDLIVRKLSDVGRIFRCYNDMLSKYTDSLDYTKKASEIIAKKDSRYFEGSCVFVDCFNDFTGSQLEFIRRMTAKAENTVFAIVADNNRENLFGRISAQRDRILDFAKNEGIETEIVSDNIEKRLKGALGELSENIFGNGKSGADASGIFELVTAKDVYSEADYIAAKIKNLCLDGELLYRDTAVLCADAENGKYIRNALEKYEIPFFLDIPEPILYQPLVSFFVSLLNTLKNFTPENVLSCLKTGFYSKPDKDGKAIAISNKDIDVFENYILEWNLSAKHLKKEFKFADEKDFNQIDAEKIRKAVAEPILKLRDEMKNKDGSEITRMLYSFAVDNAGLERALRARCYDNSGDEKTLDADALRVNQQVWNQIAEILGALEAELSGVYITIDEYSRLFSEICANTTLAKPPQFRDCVLVGDINRTRADGVKAVFIAGATYENLPSVPSGMGVFSEYEAERITDIIRKNTNSEDTRLISFMDFMGFKEQYCLSLYRTYRAISLPTEFLCISCPQYDASGKQVSRSSVFKDAIGVFPEIKTIKAEDMDEMFYCRSLKAVKQRYSENLGSYSHNQNVLRAYLEDSGNESFVSKLNEIHKKQGADNSAVHNLSQKTANQLFNTSLGKTEKGISLGATSIEKIMECPFSFFCTRELGVREIRKREFNSANRGNAVHYIMEQVFLLYKDNMDEFFGLSRNDFLKLSRKYISEYIKSSTNNDDNRSSFLFNNIAHTAADLLVTMQTELSIKSYQPQFFELNISKEETNKFTLNTKEFHGDVPEKTANEAEDIDDETGGETAKQDENDDTKEFELYSKPLSIKIDDKTEILVGGKADRIDVMYAKDGNESRLYLRIIDYKSKAKTFEPETAQNGGNIQMLLYLRALCDANSGNKTANILPGEISYISSENSGTAKTRQEALYLLEISHLPKTFYISDDVIQNNLKKISEKFAAEIKKGIANDAQNDAVKKIQSAFALNDKNSLSPEEFKEFSDKCLENVKEKISGIYGGDVSAVPIKTDKKMPCDYCGFKRICGYTK